MNKLKFYEYENMEDFFYRHEGTTVIQATGEDAEDYLQSQWSIDLRKLQIGHVRYGLRLSSKGKILAGAYIARIEEEEFLLISPENSGVQIIKLMEENVVADEVEFLDVSKSWQMHSLFTEGSESPNLIPQVDLSALQMQKFVKFKNGIVMADEKMPDTFYLTLCQEDYNLEKHLEEGLQRISKERYDFLRIKFANYSIPHEIGDEDLPQEAKMEQKFVDFNKGCYLGQEVMARLHAMGQVQREVISIRWETSNTSCPTLPVLVMMDQKQVGQVKSIVRHESEWVGVAKIHLKSKDRLLKHGLDLEDTSMGKIYFL